LVSDTQNHTTKITLLSINPHYLIDKMTQPQLQQPDTVAALQ
jgi:hypothetical protein